MRKYVFVILFLFIESIYCTSFAKLPVVWSVYGARILSDDAQSFELLDRLAQNSGNESVDFLNSLALIDVAEVSDGIISEYMGGVCIDDLTNKTKTIISIFDKFGQDKLEPYFDLVSGELYLSNSHGKSVFNNFVVSLKPSELNPHELDILQRIIDLIKNKLDILIECE